MSIQESKFNQACLWAIERLVGEQEVSTTETHSSGKSAEQIFEQFIQNEIVAPERARLERLINA